MKITLTERDRRILRVLLKEQKKVAARKGAWRRRRDAKHYWPEAEGRAA